MSTFTVITYFWQSEPGSKLLAPYTADQVRALQRMVAKHLARTHEFAVVTDRPELFDADQAIRAIPLDWTTHVPNTCFAKLMIFHPDGAAIFGEHVLQLDLDTAIVGDLEPIASRTENLVMWRNPALNPKFPGRSYYNSSVILHRCGTMPGIWENFARTGEAQRRMHKNDQWYLSFILGTDKPCFDGEHDGVYRLARDDTPNSGVGASLPANARIVTFPGDRNKPWFPEVQRKAPWLKEHGF